MRNYRDLFAYTPRALQVALFSPFPDTWFSAAKMPGGSVMRLVAAIEMLVFYGVLGVIIVGLSRGTYSLWQVGVIAIFAIAISVIYAYAVTNVGALYRFRYVSWLLFYLLAITSLLLLRNGKRDTWA